MSKCTVRVIDVYPYREIERGLFEFLLLRRAPGVKYAGQWRMVGGKIREGETAWQAAIRETEEETGASLNVLWVVPSFNTIYEWEYDRLNLVPAFAAEMSADPILNYEHDSFVWLSAREASLRLKWPEQKRLILLANDMLQQGIPPELIVTSMR